MIAPLFLLAFLADPLPRGYVCYRAPEPIRIDGRIDAQWNAAPWTADFADIEGAVRPNPRFRTRARMMWDAQYFYFAAELTEPHAWATLTNHDAVIFHDNDFEIFIDPNGDSHEYFEFEINALNTTWDLFLPKPYKDSGKADNGWEIPGLRSAIEVRGSLNDPRDRDEGWTVEVAIPWASFARGAHMPLPPRDADQWRVNFSRVEWRHQLTGDGKYQRVPGVEADNWVWSPQYAINMHLPELWGYVQFSTQTAGPVEFRPDASWPERQNLQSYYRAQHAFWRTNKRQATEAEVPSPAGLRVTRTAAGWRACATSLCIEQDSKVSRVDR